MKFFKFEKSTTTENITPNSRQAEKKSKENGAEWKSVSYHSSVAQRNVLVFLSLICLVSSGISSFSVYKISYQRNIEPFAVEIEKKSGIATLVDPMTVKEYSAIDSLNEFFLIDYIRARELFIPSLMEYNYYKKVRVFSSQTVYDDFRHWIRLSNPKSPITMYSNVANGELKVRSVQVIYPGTVQIRFGMEFTGKDRVQFKSDRIATISFQYVSMQLTEDERRINPLGFQITYYKADDEFL